MVTDRRGEGRFFCGKELIEKHGANWPATGCNNMLSTYELWEGPGLAMDSFHFTCYLMFFSAFVYTYRVTLPFTKARIRKK
jgi:hypothetical protein